MTREQRLEQLVRGLVEYLNERGYHNSLPDTWVAEKDSTTYNQELEDLGLPTLQRSED